MSCECSLERERERERRRTHGIWCFVIPSHMRRRIYVL